jgi:hypothetical protein
MKHETLRFSQWKQKHFEPHCGMQFIPTMGTMKEWVIARSKGWPQM